MARLVRVRVVDEVAVVTLDAPPVNALSAAVRAGLWEAVGRIEAQSDIKVAVLMASGRLFSAGADIREFDIETQPPSLAQLCDRVEGCETPIVAALHGQALGGGAELALSAHYRVADKGARIGLPEVALGLVPGAGGTQRLPRLVGAEGALHMMISTTPVDAVVAHRLGLLDGLIEGDLASGAVAFAKDLLARGAGVRRTCDQRERIGDGRAFQGAVAKARAALAGNPLHAPHRVVDCVEAAALLPFAAGLAFEEDAFARCLEHPQSAALRHVFVAERRADNALIERTDTGFKPAVPMGKSAVLRLRKVLRAAAEAIALGGRSEAEIDGAMVAYGFRKGPFGGKDAGPDDFGIARQIMAALLAEGAKCVDEGAVQRPADVDALAVHGLGFPRRKGGPFRAAQSAGLLHLRNEMRDWAEADEIWAVPPLLDHAVLEADGFDEMNKG